MIDVQSCEMVALMQTLLIHFRFGQFIELNITLEFLFFHSSPLTFAQPFVFHFHFSFSICLSKNEFKKSFCVCNLKWYPIPYPFLSLCVCVALVLFGFIWIKGFNKYNSFCLPLHFREIHSHTPVLSLSLLYVGSLICQL